MCVVRMSDSLRLVKFERGIRSLVLALLSGFVSLARLGLIFFYTLYICKY